MMARSPTARKGESLLTLLYPRKEDFPILMGQEELHSSKDGRYLVAVKDVQSKCHENVVHRQYRLRSVQVRLRNSVSQPFSQLVEAREVFSFDVVFVFVRVLWL